MKCIDFSPPFIPGSTIKRIKKVIKSGWITTANETKKFEENIKEFLKVKHVIATNSATSGMELVLRILGIGEGDEVITTPYTYTATASVILHVGAKPIFVDVQKDKFHIDINKIAEKISKKTKAILTVDYGGFPVDYDKILKIINSKKKLFRPRKDSLQEKFNRIVLISDSAHSFGAKINSLYIGNQADFTIFSFHAVKNVTTAEGGAIIVSDKLENLNIDIDELVNYLRILILHGQTKNAFDKYKGNSWKYDVIYPGFKMNMPDILAAIGNEQIKIYEKKILKKRKKIFMTYLEILNSNNNIILPLYFLEDNRETSYHLFPIRIKEADESKRNSIIKKLKKFGINTNVHFIPLPLLSYYKNIGYNINDYKNSYDSYKNEISLPIYFNLKIKDVKYIANKINYLLK